MVGIIPSSTGGGKGPPMNEISSEAAADEAIAAEDASEGTIYVADDDVEASAAVESLPWTTPLFLAITFPSAPTIYHRKTKQKKQKFNPLAHAQKQNNPNLWSLTA